MVEELIQLDKNLFLFLNNLGTPNWDGFWMFLTNKFSAIPLYVFLLFMSYRQFGTKKTLVLLVSVALLITATNGLADFFKYGVQRLRPCYDPEINEIMRLVKKSCGGRFSYFSAHTANSFAVAFFFTFLLRHTFKYIGVLLIFWAILVSYSRIYIGVHFPLDILTGAVVGLIFSWLFTKLYIFAIHKFHL
ncbi:MAG: phosphatase PAP2 family protein [Maribacter sp.]|nr:phosphatase PAP2 family protein [Maribacter sp.]